jgi:hypothetical protein
MRSSSSAAPRVETRSQLPAARSSARPHELARALLGPVADAQVLVISEDPALLAAGLRRGGARVTPLALGPAAPGSPDAWRSTDFPTWHFDALLADRLLSTARDLEALLYRLRTWVRPDAPFALVEPIAPPAFDPGTAEPGATLSPGDVEVIRRHLPGLRVTRLPPAEAVTSWADALRTAVEPWIPALMREVRLAVLSGTLPP